MAEESVLEALIGQRELINSKLSDQSISEAVRQALLHMLDCIKPLIDHEIANSGEPVKPPIH